MGRDIRHSRPAPIARALAGLASRIPGLRDLLGPGREAGPPPYFSNASRARSVGLGDLPGAIGVLGSPEDPRPLGIAFPAGFAGDWAGIDFRRGRPEALWRLQVGGEEIGGLWALRGGAFVRVAGPAE